ncbi:MAG: hypothetical protein ACLFPU_08375 [Dehalococcoidia bacterium]
MSFLTRPVSFRFLTRPVKFKRAAVLAWFTTFLIYARLSFSLDFATNFLFFASPLTVLANVGGLKGDAIGMIIGIALASLVVLLLACRRGLPRWKVMGASMLVWGFGFIFGYMWISFGTINPFALSGAWIPFVVGAAAFLLDFVLGLVLVVGFDKLFARVSR